MPLAPKSLLSAFLLIAFSGKAFVPVGMMLDVRSYLMGGNLVTICSSAGDLPWLLVEFDHDDMMGQMPQDQCPYAALDTPADIADVKAPSPIMLGHAVYSAATSDLIRILIARPSARAPPAA